MKRDALSKIRKAISLNHQQAPMDEETKTYVIEAFLSPRQRKQLAEVLQALMSEHRPANESTTFSNGKEWLPMGQQMMADLLACPLDLNLLSEEAKERGTRKTFGPQTPGSLLKLIAQTDTALQARRKAKQEAAYLLRAVA